MIKELLEYIMEHAGMHPDTDYHPSEEIKQALKTDEQRRTFELKMLDDLIQFAGDNVLMPCARKGKTSCLIGAEWGRPLTRKEYNTFCPACRCMWHLSAARNDWYDSFKWEKK